MKHLDNRYYMIKREFNFCPFCETEHELALIKSTQTTVIKGKEITCTVYSYLCENTNEVFENGYLLDHNLQLFRDEYRRANGLLTRKEIINIREKFKLTQEEFAIILGLGEKTIARYESSSIQDKPYDILMRKFSEDYNFAYDMLMKVKGNLNTHKFDIICENLKALIVQDTPSRYNDIQLYNLYLSYNNECSENGYTLLNIPKIKSMLAYFARYTQNLFNVKVMKLFWYSDVLSFLRTGKAMTGLVYNHMQFGALPVGYIEIGNLDSVKKEYIVIADYYATVFVPKEIDQINEALFTSDELKVLYDVCKRFKTTSGKDISDIMHEEDAYKLTEPKEIIDFSIIKSLKAIQ